MHVTLRVQGPDLDIPQHPDGDTWVHVLDHGGPDGDEITFADTAGEALAVLVDGYDAIAPDDIDEAELARYEHAVQIAAKVQAFLLELAVSERRFSREEADEDALTILLTDKAQTLPTDLAVKGWANDEVPLVLVDLNYSPYSDEVVPAGNVLVLTAHDEISYLTSLSDIGMVRYHVHSTGEKVESHA